MPSTVKESAVPIAVCAGAFYFIRELLSTRKPQLNNINATSNADSLIKRKLI